jgi:hypothetical protein
MFPRLRKPVVFRPLLRPFVRLAVSHIRVPAQDFTAAGARRHYASGPGGGGGFPGGLQFGMEKMEKGQALKEFVKYPCFESRKAFLWII